MVSSGLMDLYERGLLNEGELIGFNLGNRLPFVIGVVGGELIEGWPDQTRPSFAFRLEDYTSKEKGKKITLPLEARGIELLRPNTSEPRIKMLGNYLLVGDMKSPKYGSHRVDRFYIGQERILEGLVAIDEQDQGATAIYQELIRRGQLVVWIRAVS